MSVEICGGTYEDGRFALGSARPCDRHRKVLGSEGTLPDAAIHRKAFMRVVMGVMESPAVHAKYTWGRELAVSKLSNAEATCIIHQF